MSTSGGKVPITTEEFLVLKKNATESLVTGNGWWLVGHVLASDADDNGRGENKNITRNAFLYWVEFTKKYYKALDCQSHFVEFCDNRDPASEYGYFKWTVDAHNDVNERNGRKIYSLREARRAMVKPRSDEDFARTGPGCWAFIHQTALHLVTNHVDKKIVFYIHRKIARSPIFGAFYSVNNSSDSFDLFPATVTVHNSRRGKIVSIEQATEIWGPGNVKESPCQGPPPGEEDGIYDYDVLDESYDTEDDEEDSYVEERPPVFGVMSGFFNVLEKSFGGIGKF